MLHTGYAYVKEKLSAHFSHQVRFGTLVNRTCKHSFRITIFNKFAQVHEHRF